MRRARFALALARTIACAASLLACDPRRVLRGTASETTADAAAKPEAGAAPGPRACHPPGPGELSDDDHPDVTPIASTADIGPWLEARGVTRRAAAAWYRSRFAPHVDAEAAETALSGAASMIVVGDRREEALVIRHGFRWGWTPEKILVVTVRNKRIVPLLDVGLSMTAMDWPGVRHLDLALDIAPDGMSITLRDRAPNGTKLVEPASACRARNDRLAACQRAIDTASEPEGWCPIARDADGKNPHLVASPTMDVLALEYPAEMHDCATAVPYFEREVKSMKSDPEAALATAFVQRACRDRGTWRWKGDTFAHP